MEDNTQYLDRFVESKLTQVIKDPDGNNFVVYQGQQFKYKNFYEDSSGCSGCGTRRTVTVYLIDSYAHCEEGNDIWGGQAVEVDSKTFQETESLKWPPVVNNQWDETSGKTVELFKHPSERSIPREGLWYEDPWLSKRDS
jgi:hypothetical protein